MRRTARVLLAATLLVPLSPAAPAAGATPRLVRYTQWDTPAQLASGTARGTVVARGRLKLAVPQGTTTLNGTMYEWADWTSPYVEPGFDLTELVPSWEASTPGDTWIRVSLRGLTGTGTSTGWDSISRWAAGDRFVRRSSYGSQPDGGASVRYDTWAVPAGVRQWQLRVTLLRKKGTTRTPSVDTIGAMVSRLPAELPATSKPSGVAAGIVLPVPRFSQMIHEGEYPEYDGGGEAWCSPTSTSMVLAYYDALPPPTAYEWVDPAYRDRFVAHAARQTFDHSFDGTGNWPFNTAYAATRTGRAFVTRLRDLRDAERFIAAGIPVVASIEFSKGELDGAPISSTDGHLLVVVGFTADGDVVVNDPAAPRNRGVRRTYDRAQLEAAWLGGSGGLSYIVSDRAHPLPARNGATSW
ncbi:MAG TPA: peptidase C39 family protein [Nocardioidaceae bacterium]|nr:peptidase C39 family protein [Nocardioidaceae bacterium]